MKYPEDFLNKIICGDNLDIMRQMPNESIDLVVTSPPYNLKNSTGNGMKAGTKFRLRQNRLPDLYDEVEEI
jgi:modification methylase